MIYRSTIGHLSVGEHYTLFKTMKVGHCKDCDETLPCLLQAFVRYWIDHCKFKGGKSLK